MVTLNITWDGIQPLQGIEPGESFIETLNVLQGAVTTDGFTVNAKMVNAGKARLAVYSNESRTNLIKTTNLVETDENKIIRLQINGLQADTTYYWSINSNGQKASILGKASTFPVGPSSYKILASSCARGSNGEGGSNGISNHPVFNNMRTSHSDAKLFLHMGDLHYRNINSNNVSQYHKAYDDVLAQSNKQGLYKDIPICYMFDDHDFGPDDASSISPGRPAALSAYKSRVPHFPLAFNGNLEPLAQTFAIGRVRYFILDVRSQRVDYQTLLGTIQKQWFKNMLLSTTEPVICLQVVVPWITSVEYNGWNTASDEKDELLQFFIEHNLIDRIFMIYGDTHMSAIDDGTNSGGFPVFLFSSLDSGGTQKGGPYSEGSYLDAAGGQYGTIEVTDTGGNSISIKGTAYRYKNGTETELLSFTKVFNANI